VVVGLALILEGQTAIGHVVQVLEPLKVGDGDTADIDKHVRNNQLSFSCIVFWRLAQEQSDQIGQIFRPLATF
jgi:hypothetical protein